MERLIARLSIVCIQDRKDTAMNETETRMQEMIDRLNAASEGEWIAKGARVRVVGSEGDHLVVRETKNTR